MLQKGRHSATAAHSLAARREWLCRFGERTPPGSPADRSGWAGRRFDATRGPHSLLRITVIIRNMRPIKLTLPYLNRKCYLYWRKAPPATAKDL
jgi:hypothetical protein